MPADPRWRLFTVSELAGATLTHFCRHATGLWPSYRAATKQRPTQEHWYHLPALSNPGITNAENTLRTHSESGCGICIASQFLRRAVWVNLAGCFEWEWFLNVTRSPLPPPPLFTKIMRGGRAELADTHQQLCKEWSYINGAMWPRHQDWHRLTTAGFKRLNCHAGFF